MRYVYLSFFFFILIPNASSFIIKNACVPRNMPFLRGRVSHKTFLRSKNLPENEAENDDENLPLPPWAQQFSTKKMPQYKPEKYDFRVYNEYFKTLCAEKREELRKYQLPRTKEEETGTYGGRKSYGFKIKQIQPLKYHQGSVYTYFYMHALDMSIAPIFLNSIRRVLLEFTPSGRCTALRIEGMKHEFYSIVGVREEFYNISFNLREIIFKNVPLKCDMDNAVYARFRIKGPMTVVAGHMQFFKRTVYTPVENKYFLFKDEVGRYNYSSTQFNQPFNYTVVDGGVDIHDNNILHLKKEYKKMKNNIIHNEEEIKNIKIINPNQYICTVSAGSYLCMDIKIENICTYVMPEYGPESLDRNTDINNFIHFCSSATPVSTFCFNAERRGINKDELTEITTIEMHTDGSITPRLGMLNACNILLSNFYQLHFALHFNSKIGKDGSEEVLTEDEEWMDDPERFQGVPWNPWKSPAERRKEKEAFFSDRTKIRRQIKIPPNSEEAKKEQKDEFLAKVKFKKDMQERLEKVKKQDIQEYYDKYEPWPESTDEDVHNPPDWVPKMDVPNDHCGGISLPFFRSKPLDD